jgi:hypothetical protein
MTSSLTNDLACRRAARRRLAPQSIGRPKLPKWQLHRFAAVARNEAADVEGKEWGEQCPASSAALRDGSPPATEAWPSTSALCSQAAARQSAHRPGAVTAPFGGCALLTARVQATSTDLLRRRAPALAPSAYPPPRTGRRSARRRPQGCHPSPTRFHGVGSPFPHGQPAVVPLQGRNRHRPAWCSVAKPLHWRSAVSVWGARWEDT